MILSPYKTIKRGPKIGTSLLLYTDFVRNVLFFIKRHVKYLMRRHCRRGIWLSKDKIIISGGPTYESTRKAAKRFINSKKILGFLRLEGKIMQCKVKNSEECAKNYLYIFKIIK